MDHLAALLALRTHLLSLRFADTGATTLGAVGTGYTRAAGSFIDDGFTPGMEVVPTGFAETAPRVIQSVSALTMTLMGSGTDPLTPQAEAAGRSLHVGIPAIRGWENVEMVPQDGMWYIEEDYLPGPTTKMSVGNRSARLIHYPTYVLRLSGLAGIGVTALYRVSDALLNAFFPGFSLPLPDGWFLTVRGDPAPYKGQVLQLEAGRANVAITFPLWVQSVNPS